MALTSIDQFARLRRWLMRMRTRWLRVALGVDVDLTLEPSMSSRFISSKRGSIVIGTQTLVAFKVMISSRDYITGEDRQIRIGARCFIGGGSTILPGVTIGDECIVGAGAVVFDDAPPRSIIAGNPARVLRSDIAVGPYGRLRSADGV